MMTGILDRKTKEADMNLFARQAQEGWVCLGNEIDGLDINESIKRIKTLEK